ncbi:MAG: B12-binding domain-containing radical SAM protein [Desulfohalobiaceae bacterium]
MPLLPKWPEITWTSCKNRPSGPGLRVLGINPWIYDFAAFNLWSRPAGLLSCLELMRSSGCQVALLDCMHPTWRDMSWPKGREFGTGHYPKTVLPQPWALQDIPRRYSRYGLPYAAVKKALQQLSPGPELILLTSCMTYWYPGVLAMERLLRRIWPEVPLVLGGIYPSLCPEHARHSSQADLILEGPLEDQQNWQSLWQTALGNQAKAPGIPEPGLAQDLYPSKDFSIILGSRGCPFDCVYCASSRLYPGFAPRPAADLSRELKQELSQGILDFAFYDDALLHKAQQWLKPLLQELSRLKPRPRLHTPNAMHARYLQGSLPVLLRKAGLHTVRLGLETADFGSRRDFKLCRQEWTQAVQRLYQAGFSEDQLGAYILFGLPGQDPKEIERAISFAHRHGVQPILAYYSPIPGTELFEQARKHSPYPLAEEPLYQNSSIWPCYPGGFSWQERSRWQKLLQSKKNN